jgi:hypothetical protein
MGRMKWKSTFFEIELIIESDTEKVSQYIMRLRSDYDKNFSYNEQKYAS